MTPRLSERLGLRGRLLLATIGALALALVCLTAGFNLVLANRLDANANDVAMTRATGELAAIKVTGGRISLPETPDAGATDMPMWVFHGGSVLEQPASGADDATAAASLAGGPRRFLDVGSNNTRLYALPIVVGGRRLGTVVSAVSLAPYTQTKHLALLASIILALVLLLTIAAAARWLISRALGPVATMTRRAADWSEHDLDRRFALGQPHDELTELAATLDNLLGRLASTLRHEQRLTAELSHELRAPLTHIVAEAQHALLHADTVDAYRAGYEQILARTTAMSRTLDTLIAAARAELAPSKATSDAIECARAAVLAAEPLAERSGIALELTPVGRPRVAVESLLVGQILAPLLENSCRYATERVRARVERVDSSVRFIVDDDGPGIDPDIGETLFEPGRRGTDHVAGQAVAVQGAGLGLALARRLARSAGGDVSSETAEVGARFVVVLPAA